MCIRDSLLGRRGLLVALEERVVVAGSILLGDDAKDRSREVAIKVVGVKAPRRLFAYCLVGAPVSYTHLDVYKRQGHHYAHGLHSPYWWLKCLVGTTNEDHWWVKNYHRLLVWDIMKAPRITRWAEAMLAPLIGKSIIVYVVKP